MILLIIFVNEVCLFLKQILRNIKLCDEGFPGNMLANQQHYIGVHNLNFTISQRLSCWEDKMKGSRNKIQVLNLKNNGGKLNAKRIMQRANKLCQIFYKINTKNMCEFKLCTVIYKINTIACTKKDFQKVSLLQLLWKYNILRKGFIKNTK